MRLIKVAAAALNTTPLDWEGNKRHIVAAVRAAKAAGVGVLCLPEMCVCGYGCEDAFHSPATAATAWTVLGECRGEMRGIAVSVGLPVMYQNALFNCAAMVVDGEVMGLVAKRFLAGDGIHYEPRWFKPWPSGAVGKVSIDGREYPFGDVYFDVGGVKVGFEICEDAWVAKRPGAAMALEGVDVILNPSASHFAFGKLDVRKRFVIEGSRAFGVTYVYSNLVGNEAGRAIYDGGAVIASGGKLVATGPRFTYRDAVVTAAVVDVDATRMGQARTASFTPAIEGGREDCVRVPFAWPEAGLEPTKVAEAGWEASPHLKEEEFTRAECLALFDYLRKSRSRGFVVSLSGGADSATVTCLCAMMLRLAVGELGMDGVMAKLAYLGVPKAAPDGPREVADEDHPAKASAGVRALTRRMLLCVYQATRNSGKVTRDAARAVAEAVGAEYLELDVDPMLREYLSAVTGALGRELSWETDDIALQNIQARVRSPSVWMLANVRGALLLSTSNRSEAAVGYATMDGDTSGGLSPIAGIDKNFVRAWLRWLEKGGPAGLGPIPAVAAVNVQAPTAELRPAAAVQTDEADLMPYDLLDAIERAAIRDKRPPVEAYRLMRVAFPQYSREQLLLWVERFFNLWCRNQWKRERYAPSFHLDDENLDPKTWCRFPILSGSYQRELAELREYAKREG